MIYELRRYELFNYNKKAFHDRFENHVIRLFKKHNIEIIGAWETYIGDAPEFTYIIAWKSLGEREIVWSNFDGDEEWSQIKKDTYEKHGQLVNKTHSKILKPTTYSPLK